MEKKLQKIYLYITVIDIARFMSSSLSNLLNNLSVGIERIKCKFGHGDKKCENCGIKYKYCDFFLEYSNFKDNSIKYKCLLCNKNCQLLLQKGVYPYQCMDD